MGAILVAAYSALVYVFFFVTFLYAIGFVEDAVVPKTIDSGSPAPVAASIVVDVLLLGLFAVQHSVMARPAFKRWWTRLVPTDAERSTFVLLASLALALICWQWRPLPQPVWAVTNAGAAAALVGLSLVGWAVVLISTFLINHFELFGLSQGSARLLRRQPSEAKFVTPLFYRWVRHPIYVGFLVAFWATPRMTVGHLVFAIATTGYIFVGVWFEERDLVAHYGDQYRAYRARVGFFFPNIRARGVSADPKAP
jgi:protein-S-isoprenylcysteine O-methyltransferase Ste14